MLYQIITSKQQFNISFHKHKIIIDDNSESEKSSIFESFHIKQFKIG